MTSNHETTLSNTVFKPTNIIEYGFEYLIFNSRWLLAPFYFGLILGVLILMVRFSIEFFHLLNIAIHAESSQITMGLLNLVDATLFANLLILMVFIGYETFVSKINNAEGHEDRPDWMGKVSFSGLKIKVFSSVVAISGIELLHAFLNLNHFNNEQLAWKVGIHITFVISGVLLSVMDKLEHH